MVADNSVFEFAVEFVFEIAANLSVMSAELAEVMCGKGESVDGRHSVGVSAFLAPNGFIWRVNPTTRRFYVWLRVERLKPGLPAIGRKYTKNLCGDGSQLFGEMTISRGLVGVRWRWLWHIGLRYTPFVLAVVAETDDLSMLLGVSDRFAGLVPSMSDLR